jgi:outer membrane protein assembly factor BamE (lipoprotein component of BamABCDE complex)
MLPPLHVVAIGCGQTLDTAERSLQINSDSDMREEDVPQSRFERKKRLVRDAMHRLIAKITTASSSDKPRARAPKRRASGARVLPRIALVASVVLLAACGTEITKHGHQFRSTDMQRLQPGMSQDEVQLALGTPTTTGTVSQGSAYYYISSTKSQTAFLEPKEIDRRVLAVYFDPLGSVTRIANYGMKDGRVFDFISKTTPSANTNDEGMLRQIFRNLGRRGSLFGE